MQQNVCFVAYFIFAKLGKRCASELRLSFLRNFSDQEGRAYEVLFPRNLCHRGRVQQLTLCFEDASCLRRHIGGYLEGTHVRHGFGPREVKYII